jgi:hypothetical protein
MALEALITSITEFFIMTQRCLRCKREVPTDSVYCPYCGYGIGPCAKTTQVSAAGTLFLVAGIASLIFFILSFRALAQIYGWYPPSVARDWIIYDQLITAFSFTGMLFGFSAGLLSLSRKSYRWTMISAVLCTVSGAGAWILSMIIPYASMLYSFLYYFLPVLLTALIGTLLIYPRRAEFT